MKEGLFDVHSYTWIISCILIELINVTLCPLVYLFEPSNPTPLAVHGAVCKGCVIGGVFLPNEDAGSTGSGSKLYFMNKNQVSICVRLVPRPHPWV